MTDGFVGSGDKQRQVQSCKSPSVPSMGLQNT